MTAKQMADLIDWVFSHSYDLLIAFVLLIIVLALISEVGKIHDKHEK
jgi:hypothetical protein